MRKLLLILCLQASLCATALGADRQALFAVPDFTALPPAVETVKETTEEGVITTELYFAGAPFNGTPTRIYAFYARPEAPGKYPGVVQLHGAGLATLSPTLAQVYAKNGYAAIAIDWAGPGPKRVGPTSTFTAVAGTATPVLLPDGSVDKTKKWTIPTPEQSSVTNGVRFVRRAFMFLRSRPEVDPDKLCLSGMSAGAYLSLMVIAQEPTLKAAAVKYGCGYIRDFPGYFGGYYSPLILGTKEDQDVWLDALDPKWYLGDYKASVLMLSGTNDIFFMMPLVLETWRHIASPNRLVMLPNDNHSQVGNELFPLRYFNSVFGTAPAFPEATKPTVTVEGANLRFTSTVTGPSKLTKVDFCVMCMPLLKFAPNSKETKWTLVPATQDGNTWTATAPAPQGRQQLIAYLHAEDETGAKVSSDTVEVPDFPKWHGLPQVMPPDTLDDGNYFLDPSLEEQKRGRLGDMYLNFVGAPKWDATGAQAHTGKVAVGLGQTGKDYLACGAPAQGGKSYRLSGFFRAERDGAKLRLQINWQQPGGGPTKFELKDFTLTTEYQACELVVTAPADATGALLIIGGLQPNETVWMDDVYYGEAN